MEDLATARISVAQTAQRLLHGATCEDTGRQHDRAFVKELLGDEHRDIQRLLDQPTSDVLARYERAAAISEAWIARYLELDFRSLGTFTRDELTSAASGAL